MLSMIEHIIVSRALAIGLYSAIAVSIVLFLVPRGQPAWVTGIKAWGAAYITLVLIVYAINYYIAYRVDTFDLDGNGIFTPNESVGDFTFYYNTMFSGSGRTMIPLTGLIGAFVAAVAGFVIGSALRFVGRAIR
ncbi:hypothetical protein H4S14_002974 [Agrobacterium vitis]|nr:hypothetical protein [Agrobacterium vitis]MBE1439212.1 hypothetical protein [Agrobacterium vitis]